MSYKKVLAAAAVVFAASTPFSSATTIDLRVWTQENYTVDSGNWVPEVGAGIYVDQVPDSNPSVFYSDFNAINTRINAKVRVGTFSDDDYIGFVLGWDGGDFSTDGADYLLIDWKQGRQSSSGHIGEVGLALSRVSNGPADALDLWGHDNNVTELARGMTLGNTGWADITEYDFTIDFFNTNVKVWIDGVLQFDVAGNFDEGAVGFYTFSQRTVRYSEVEMTPLRPQLDIFEPGTVGMMGLSLLGLAAYKRQRKA